MRFFKRKETDEEILVRLLKLTNSTEDCGIFGPPLNAQTALDELRRYFLGEDWYSVNPISREQLNMEIVYEIECKLKKYKYN